MTTNIRQSNFELLRIIAMFMVLALHVNYFSLGRIQAIDFTNNSFPTMVRHILEVVPFVAVNIFVLISGWFGIKYTTKGFCKFIFQCGFTVLLVGIFGKILGYSVSGTDIFYSTAFQSWFVISYIGLYLLAPILNTFIQHINKRQLAVMVFIFFVYQTYFGWLREATDFNSGKSALSFIGLYLLARYFKLYGSHYAKHGLRLAVFSTIISIVYVYIYIRYEAFPLRPYHLAYASPFVIAAALGWVLWFSTIKLGYNKWINFIAASSFGVYLLHMGNGWAMDEYIRISKLIYGQYSGITYIVLITLFMICVYLCAIAIDQIRKVAWKTVISLNTLYQTKRNIQYTKA